MARNEAREIGNLYQTQYWDFNWFVSSGNGRWGPIEFEEDTIPGIPNPGGDGSRVAKEKLRDIENQARNTTKGGEESLGEAAYPRMLFRVRKTP